MWPLCLVLLALSGAASTQGKKGGWYSIRLQDRLSGVRRGRVCHPVSESSTVLCRCPGLPAVLSRTVVQQLNRYVAKAGNFDKLLLLS